MSRTPSKLAEPPPTCGEHTDEVLADIGYSVEEIARLREAEII